MFASCLRMRASCSSLDTRLPGLFLFLPWSSLSSFGFWLFGLPLACGGGWSAIGRACAVIGRPLAMSDRLTRTEIAPLRNRMSFMWAHSFPSMPDQSPFGDRRGSGASPDGASEGADGVTRDAGCRRIGLRLHHLPELSMKHAVKLMVLVVLSAVAGFARAADSAPAAAELTRLLNEFLAGA